MNNINNIIINKLIEIEDYKKYNYNDKELFILHIEFLKNIYNFEIRENIDELINHNRGGRVEAKNWSERVKNYYNNRCILSNDINIKKLEACHIIEIKDKETNELTHNIYNSLCLTGDFHKLFDDYSWTINPETLRVEISDNYEYDDLEEYRDKKIEINNEITIKALEHRYKKFNNNKILIK